MVVLPIAARLVRSASNAARSSSGEAMPSNLAVTLPVPSTTKMYGSVGRPQMFVALSGTGRLSSVSTGWSEPFVYVSSYGSTWMNVSLSL